MNKKVIYLSIIVLTLIIAFFVFGNFLIPSYGQAHAQVQLHDQLVPATSEQQWIFTVWRTALAVADLVVIVMLLFVAIVNIIHIQYDTYAIKKTLPLLIGGIIMSHFSLLICRMIVDAAQVIANTFARNPNEIASDLLCAMGLNTGAAAAGAIAALPLSIILLIVILIVALIAIAILSFLLWIRLTVIYLLTAVSPVAFILYSFPMTQGLFKTWWSWFLKWTFMGPVVMLLIWVASEIGGNNCNEFRLSTFLATAGVVSLAAVVPFKFGAGVMDKWAGFGKWATGTNKDGYLRKPADKFIQNKKDLAKGAVNDRFYGGTRFGRFLDRGRKAEELQIADYKNRRDRQLTDRESEVRDRHAHFSENEKELERAKNRLDTNIKMQVAAYMDRNRAAIGNEKMNAINAAGEVERVETNAEREERERLGVSQSLREKEVQYAKTELERQKGNLDADIREGRFENLSAAENGNNLQYQQS